MGFLDNIGQRPSEPRPTASRPSVAENVIRGDAAVPVRTAPVARDSSQPNRIHPLVIWSAVLIVVAAIGAGAWLGLRHSAMFSPATETQATADASAQAAQPVPPPTEKRASARPQPAGRRVSRSGTATASPSASGESSTQAEVPAIAPARQAADLAETTTTQVETASDPIVAVSIPALPEDDNVYSSEGGGVVAPRLTSLGFVRRLVSGLRVRTSTIELVVSKDGTVERAKIYSTPAHWEDALLLSRAKMLQFVPAHRDGFPVRYRYVMDVDTSP